MDELAERVVRAVESLGGIDVLVLFGSRASGRGRPDSDIDVAILPSPGSGPDRRLLQREIALRLAPLVTSGRVDVVLLDEAPELLRQRIMEGGRLLACANHAAWHALRIRTMREHADREHVRALFRSSQRQRLERGDFSGRQGRSLASVERTRGLAR